MEGCKTSYFLDIDRVINVSEDSANNIKRIRLLTELCEGTDAKIVLSSNHRFFEKQFKVTKERLNRFENIYENDVIPFSSRLLTIDRQNRGELIKRWLYTNQGYYNFFVIFDDKPESQFRGLERDFIRTIPHIGLTQNNVLDSLSK